MEVPVWVVHVGFNCTVVGRGIEGLIVWRTCRFTVGGLSCSFVSFMIGSCVLFIVDAVRCSLVIGSFVSFMIWSCLLSIYYRRWAELFVRIVHD